MKNILIYLSSMALVVSPLIADDRDLFNDFDLEVSQNDRSQEVSQLNEETQLKKIILTDGDVDLNSSSSEDKKEDHKKFIKMASMAGIAIVLFANDREIQDFVLENKNSFTEEVSVFGERFGAGGYSMAYLLSAYVAGTYILGVYKDNDKLKAYAIYGIKSVAYAGLITRLGKQLFGRVRPSNTDDPYDFEGPTFSTSNVSFPSGHSAFAWSFATFLAIAHKDKPIVPILAYSAATLAAFSRVHDNKHWASDVFVGSAIGHFVTKWVMKKFPKFDVNGRRCHDTCGEELPFSSFRKSLDSKEIEEKKKYTMIPMFSTDDYGNFKMNFTWIGNSKDEEQEILEF
tara:strand:+ start:86194 stop:87222 length:1029 start_codon:yes stop_codon:yes gene_type:complete